MAGPKPFIPEGYDLYLDAFFRLNSERHNSEGIIGSIPVTKIMEYSNWLDIKNVNKFIDVIIRMDVSYVNEVSAQIKKQYQQASKGK